VAQSSWERGRDSMHFERDFLTVNQRSGTRKGSTKTIHRYLGERGNSCDLKPWTMQNGGGWERRRRLPGENHIHP